MTNALGSALVIPPPARPARRLLQAAALSAAAIGMVAAGGMPAMAAPTDTVTANVVVDSVIDLAMDPGFTIEGAPGTTAGDTVDGTVTTNNQAGYSVSVVAAAATLAPATQGNPDSIAIADLTVHNAADSAYVPLSDAALDAVTTNTQATRSDLAGDDFTDDYQMLIPNVNSDTYTVTLNYTATALA